MAGPLDFWQIVKEINPAGVREEAEEPFVLAAVADPDEGPIMRRAFGMDNQERRNRAGDRWLEIALPMGDDARRLFAKADIAVTHTTPSDSRVPTWVLEPADAAGIAAGIADILDRHPTLLLALPRYVPAFRREATSRIINRTARANAEVALVSAIPGILPWTAFLLPVTSLPDMALLTKNQVMMALKIAAAYGKEVEPSDRMKEVAGVVGVAFGWRALARELVGVVPGGVGAVAKSAIAYAGTVATGRAVQAYYETGATPSDREVRQWFREALAKGRHSAADAWENLRHHRGSRDFEPSAA
jgi:uncharacterized protein (DUF697 family)